MLLLKFINLYKSIYGLIKNKRYIIQPLIEKRVKRSLVKIRKRFISNLINQGYVPQKDPNVFINKTTKIQYAVYNDYYIKYNESGYELDKIYFKIRGD